MTQEAPNMMHQLLPDSLGNAAEELCSYWRDSFGNASRIDYGTGR